MKLTLSAGQNLYFTSDSHFSHSNICSATTKWENAKGKTRQFSSLDKMNSTIVDNINSVVGENDILFHLGDWSFGGFDQIEKFRSQLICKNIHVVVGNHDHHITNNKEDIQSLFTSVNYFIPELLVRRPVTRYRKMVGYDRIEIERFRFCLFHYPIASWIDMNEGVIHLHGHVHLPKHLRLGKGRSLDVGMDGNDMKPLSLDDVMKLVQNQPIRKLELPEDHHEQCLVQ
jgi:calcineurin-like phosphoesterase family protein